MGEVIRPRVPHWRLSADSLKPNKPGSMRCGATASEITRLYSGGIARRCFQLLTADMPTPANEAALAVPPSASTTASTVSSIPPYSSRFVNVSSLHEMAVDFEPGGRFKKPMAETNKTIGIRLGITREALDLSAAELCRRIKCKPNRWSQYESGERRITLPVANRLCDEFGLSLDWIYRANPSQLPHALRLKMPRPAA